MTTSRAPMPTLLIVGTPESSQTAMQTLRGDGTLAEYDILTRFRAADAPSLLSDGTDIGVVLLLWQSDATESPVELVSSILALRPESFIAVMVRSREGLQEAVKSELWRLGVADRLFAQAIESPDLTHSVAALMRDHMRNRRLVAVSDSSRRFEYAKTLRELADLILAVIHEQDIGTPGGLFCLLSTSAEPRLMIVAGTGRYSGVGCMPLENFEDRRAVEAIHTAMNEQQSRFTEETAVLYIETVEGEVACVYLTLEAPLLSWQRQVVRALTKAFSIAIGKTQAEQRLLRTQHATITTMATLAEYRDVDTGEHVARVAREATEIAQVLADRGDLAGADKAIVEQIGLASILHDIGKIAIPEGILLKPGALDAAERKTMEAHALLGSEILLRAARRSDNAELLRTAAVIALRHHERYDGTGYPGGLRGEEIPLSARIVALVDVFDALTSLRPYKQAWPLEKAIETIRAGAGSHFDPRVVDAFLLMEERRRSADFFVWTEAMSVGHPLLDLDHKRLIGVINRLWIADGEGNRQVIEFVLDDLLHYTESHFKREEQMMAEGGYPDFDRHTRVHQGICHRIEEIRWEYFQGIRDGLRGEILGFLKDWLYKHILVEDMAYRPYLAAAPSTIDPESEK